MTEEHKPAQHAENCCWHPDSCDCELGRLRAENEKLKAEMERLKSELHRVGGIAGHLVALTESRGTARMSDTTNCPTCGGRVVIVPPEADGQTGYFYSPETVRILDLEAENEKLKAKVNSLKTKLNISSDVAELEFDKAEELRDWQRRALTWVRFARKEVKYFDGYINGYGSESEIDKLIAEAEEQPG